MVVFPVRVAGFIDGFRRGTGLFSIGLIGFAILYTPVSMVLGLVMNAWSRKNEYEADAFAARNYDGNFLISGLKKDFSESFE
ncbi:MAG: M48 family metalloprotease [Odoribacter sp.]